MTGARLRRTEVMSVAMTEATDGTVSICTVRGNMMALQEATIEGDGSGKRCSIRTEAQAYLVGGGGERWVMGGRGGVRT